jgi:hypothetical protein
MLGLSLVTTSGSAWSQSLDYGPLATAIPSLGGVALVLLSAMMFVALWQMKRRGMIGGSRFMALALVSGALASGVSGVKLVADVRATPVDKELTNPSGGTIDLDVGFNCVRNATDVVQEVRSINIGPPPSNSGNAGTCPESGSYLPAAQGGDPADECEEGTRLAPNYACFVEAGEPGQLSDLRLKADIVRVGTAANGLPLYEFRYLGGETRYRGVMAQDVLRHTPEAVVTMDNGYLAVRYDRLGLEMTAVQ